MVTLITNGTTPLLERPLTVGHVAIGGGLLGIGAWIGKALWGARHHDDDDAEIVVVDTE